MAHGNKKGTTVSEFEFGIVAMVFLSGQTYVEVPAAFRREYAAVIDKLVQQKLLMEFKFQPNRLFRGRVSQLVCEAPEGATSKTFTIKNAPGGPKTFEYGKMVDLAPNEVDEEDEEGTESTTSSVRGKRPPRLGATMMWGEGENAREVHVLKRIAVVALLVIRRELHLKQVGEPADVNVSEIAGAHGHERNHYNEGMSAIPRDVFYNRWARNKIAKTAETLFVCNRLIGDKASFVPLPDCPDLVITQFVVNDLDEIGRKHWGGAPPATAPTPPTASVETAKPRFPPRLVEPELMTPLFMMSRAFVRSEGNPVSVLNGQIQMEEGYARYRLSGHLGLLVQQGFLVKAGKAGDGLYGPGPQEGAICGIPKPRGAKVYPLPASCSEIELTPGEAFNPVEICRQYFGDGESD